jgi:PAS domain S-box-containing protein
VLTFTNITKVKQAEQIARQAQLYFESIVETVREPLVVLDEKQRIVTCNQSFCRTFEINSSTAAGQLIYKLAAGQWNVPTLRKLLDEILPKQTTLEDFQLTIEFPKGEPRVFELNARRLAAPYDEDAKILLAMEDITDQNRATTSRGR